jgi:hypothetical protein
MEKAIKKYAKYSLSNSDIENLLDHKMNLILYPELAKFDNIDDVLGPYGACVILYLTRHNYGHWVCIFRRPGNKLEFFDSYGLMPDDELKFVSENIRRELKQDYPHLTWLLYNSGYKIEFNHHKFQKKGSDIATCGRWVVLRLLLRDISLTQFINLFKGIKNPDYIVTAVTQML